MVQNGIGAQINFLAYASEYLNPVLTVFTLRCNTAPVDRVFIVVGEMVTAYDGLEPRRDAVFVENRPTLTRCVADGGYPAPDMTLHLADRDVTNAFAFSQRLQFVTDDSDNMRGGHGEGPLRRLRYVTERQHDALRLTVDDDGKSIDCVATVAGLNSNRTSAHIIVHCEHLVTICRLVTIDKVAFRAKNRSQR